jgi:hypothetical protein
MNEFCVSPKGEKKKSTLFEWSNNEEGEKKAKQDGLFNFSVNSFKKNKKSI